MERRYGKIRITGVYWRSMRDDDLAFETFRKMQDQVLILDVEHRGEEDHVILVGYCEQFDIIEDGAFPPFYEAIVETYSDAQGKISVKQITFRRDK